VDDNTHLSREAFVHDQRQWALAIAKALLHGRLGPTEGARLMVRFRGKLGLPDDEEFHLLRSFIGLESETDDLPVGTERDLWSPNAIKQKAVEIARYDSLWGFDVRMACQRLVHLLNPLVLDQVEELDVVETLEEIVKEGFYAPQGARGAVVHVHLTPSLAYVVEFSDENGVTMALPTLLPAQVRLVWKAPST
jgi:hypothetical protein